MTAGVDRAWPVGYAGCRSGGLPTRARAAPTPSPERKRALSQAPRHFDSADIIENKRACQGRLDPRRGQQRHRVAAGCPSWCDACVPGTRATRRSRIASPPGAERGSSVGGYALKYTPVPADPPARTRAWSPAITLGQRRSGDLPSSWPLRRLSDRSAGCRTAHSIWQPPARRGSFIKPVVMRGRCCPATPWRLPRGRRPTLRANQPRRHNCPTRSPRPKSRVTARPRGTPPPSGGRSTMWSMPSATRSDPPRLGRHAAPPSCPQRESTSPARSSCMRSNGPTETTRASVKAIRMPR